MWCKACHFIPCGDNITYIDIMKNVNVSNCVKYTIDRYLNTPDKIVQ